MLHQSCGSLSRTTHHQHRVSIRFFLLTLPAPVWSSIPSTPGLPFDSLFPSGRAGGHTLCGLCLTLFSGLFPAAVQWWLLPAPGSCMPRPLHLAPQIEYLVWCPWLMSSMASQSPSCFSGTQRGPAFMCTGPPPRFSPGGEGPWSFDCPLRPKVVQRPRYS